MWVKYWPIFLIYWLGLVFSDDNSGAGAKVQLAHGIAAWDADFKMVAAVDKGDGLIRLLAIGVAKAGDGRVAAGDCRSLAGLQKGIQILLADIGGHIAEMIGSQALPSELLAIHGGLRQLQVNQILYLHLRPQLFRVKAASQGRCHRRKDVAAMKGGGDGLEEKGIIAYLKGRLGA